MKLWIVTDSCYECRGNPVAVFETERDAESLCHKYPWLTWDDVESEELISTKYDTHDRYEAWFNEKADRMLRERSHDCD